jgi:hypothetical protein
MAKEKVMVSEQYLQDIANSIRTKLNEEDTYKPSEFSSKIDEMNIAPKIEKGLIINKYDENGHPLSANLIGMTSIPSDYLHPYSNYSFFSRITSFKTSDDLISIDTGSFEGCQKLMHLELSSNLSNIGRFSLQNCKNLTRFIIRATTPPTLYDFYVLSGTPIASGTGYIYVPDESVIAYQTATNWSTYAAQIKPISELPTE